MRDAARFHLLRCPPVTVHPPVNRIGPLRESRYLTKSELARRVGVHRLTLNRYETGERDIPAWLAVEVARVLKVSVEDLQIRRVDPSA